jgi:hypothetical protein
VKHYRNVRWMGVLAALCAVQLACGERQDAQYGQAGAGDTGLLQEQGQQVQLTGCVERGVIPGSFMLTSVRMDGQQAATGDLRPLPGMTDEQGRPIGRDQQAEGPGAAARGTSGMTDAEGRPMGHGQPDQFGGEQAIHDTYTLRAVDGTNLGEYVGQRVAVEGRLIRNQAHDGRDVGTTGTTGTDDHAAAGTTQEPGTTAGQPGTGMAAAGAAMPMQQLAAEHIEVVDGACGTGGEAEIGGGEGPQRP